MGQQIIHRHNISRDPLLDCGIILQFSILQRTWQQFFCPYSPMGDTSEVRAPIYVPLVYTSLIINRDGWWIFTTCRLIYVIKHTYNISLWELIKESPRFGVLVASMLLSIAFVFIDVAVTVRQLSTAGDAGVNPFWKVWKSLYGSIHNLTHQ